LSFDLPKKASFYKKAKTRTRIAASGKRFAANAPSIADDTDRHKPESLAITPEKAQLPFHHAQIAPELSANASALFRGFFRFQVFSAFQLRRQ
jgi:hypothetical protein